MIQETDCAQWLSSPVSEKCARLQPMREINLRPYFGSKRKIKIFRTRILLGQSESCDIRIDDPFVSPQHAELRLCSSGDGYQVVDLGSRNGVSLNGVKVHAAPLPSQGVLRLGRSTLSWSDPVVEGEMVGNGLVFSDPKMRAVLESLKRVARSSLPVLLLGETGTGKDLLAQLLHLWGSSPDAPLVPVNGALTGGNLAESELFGHSKGAFTGADAPRLGALRTARGGTLFLDEVADMPSSAQVKLLRALETGEVKALGSDLAEKVDFRLVTATSRDVEKCMGAGTFRADLYYRIAGAVIRVPSLRERPLDILAIARKLAGERGFEFDSEADARLLSYPWPGNVRELKSCVERAILVATSQSSARILAEHLVDLERPCLQVLERGPKKWRDLEREILHTSLERNGWQRSVTAKELGLARSTLHAKMRRLGLRDSLQGAE